MTDPTTEAPTVTGEGARMTIKIDRDRMFALLGEHGERWLQGDWGDDTQMCLHGAIRQCQPQPGDAYLIERVATRQGWGPKWNDDKSTTWEQIAARCERIEVSDADLLETFGPQWKAIVALVRRAAVLNADEAKALYAARPAAWDAAQYAAQCAALHAAFALSVRDFIGQHYFTQEHYNMLTRPWAAIIGPVHPDDRLEARRD